MVANFHKKILLNALKLAQNRRGFCAPNPSVGAVIVSNNEIIAEGFHFAPGYVHAEVDALNKLTRIPLGAEMYVTLEPCCHFGRTPPCVDAIIASKIKKVFYAYQDPNPIVAGRGEQQLKAAGVECKQIRVEEIDSFYQSYRYWQQTKHPFITAKIAMSSDGKIAKENGEPVQLTSNEINRYTHQQRKKHDAILTTAKTILADNPQLNVRIDDEMISKPIYILDRKLKLTGKEKIFSTAKSITIFYGSHSVPSALVGENGSQGLKSGDLHVRFIQISEINKRKLDLNEIISFIGNDGIHDLWVEAGGKCFSSFLKANLLNRAFIYVAPFELGKGMPAFSKKTKFLLTQNKPKKIGPDDLYVIDLTELNLG